MAFIPSNYKSLEHDYRDKALKLFPWVCGKCTREFVYSNLKELTVHHVDHDHANNPASGANWELLCIYCHDHEHDKYTQADLYGATSNKEDDVEAATYNPFADLMSKMKK
ncbi:MAG TPA: HNH nuclease family protein [Psychromonas hadalis]|nr:HNH nuclease family protein [Psychromonas hadalis]